MADTTENHPGEEEAAAEPAGVMKYWGWKTMPYVIGNETFEKLGTIGTSSNLVVYLTKVYNIKNVTAVMLLNLFSGTTNLAPVIGAFLTDTYFGRYAAIGFASISSLLGMVLLTMTAGIPSLHPLSCDHESSQQCQGPTAAQFAFLTLALAFLVIGAGGIRPCNLAFGADQFNPHTDDGRRGINSFFNWYYFTFTIAMMVSLTVIIYIQSDVSWTIGLAVPAATMFASCVLFFAGTKLYVKVRPEGSPFKSFAQVFVAAFRKRSLIVPKQPEISLFDPVHRSSLVSKIPYSDQFRMLDKAAIVTPGDRIKTDGTAENPWRLCTVQQVEEVKCLARIFPVWFSGIFYYIPISQNHTFMILQVLLMDRRFGNSSFRIPAGSYSIFSMLALTIWIPVYDRILVQWLRRYTKKENGLTLLQRMGIGIVIAIVAVLVAAFVETSRRARFINSGERISGFWMAPQLTLLGISEGFNLISQFEFYYKQFPENMRSVAGAVNFLNHALANYLSNLMILIIRRTTGWLDQDLNKGRLDLYYILIGIIEVLNLIFFIFICKWYRYKELNTATQVELKEEKPISSGVEELKVEHVI